jgi:hypothetical protein
MLNSSIFGLPVDRDVIFTDHKGNSPKRIEKQQRGLFVKIPFIETFLKPDEKILLITTGYSRVNTIDQILTAWIFIYLKRSLFIFTNKRIFHIPTTVRYGYRNSIAQILYSENQSVTLKRSTLIVQCAVCGDQDKYIGIRSKERKKIRTILKKIEYNESYEPGAERAHLCPRCTKELMKGECACPKCKLKFKRKSKLRSLFPGIGYFYVRQNFLGVVNIIVELILIGILISFYMKLSQDTKSATMYLTLFGGLFIFEKIAAMYHSSHFIDEYIPEIEEVKPLLTL